MRRKRALLHLTYQRIPKPMRPSWRDWKKICGAFGDPRQAYVSLMTHAVAKLEQQQTKDNQDDG